MHDQARSRLRLIVGHRDQRRETQQHLDDAERTITLHDRLAGLLGSEAFSSTWCAGRRVESLRGPINPWAALGRESGLNHPTSKVAERSTCRCGGQTALIRLHR